MKMLFNVVFVDEIQGNINQYLKKTIQFFRDKLYFQDEHMIKKVS